MLHARPITLKEANEFVLLFHRHHKPTVGHKLSVAVYNETHLVGVAIMGRPVARAIDYCAVTEVTRLCTDGTKNACSFLYSVTARIARELGYLRIQTYILETEPGTSLLASGWKFSHLTNGGDWNHSWRKGRRVDQPQCIKQCWIKELNTRKGAA